MARKSRTAAILFSLVFLSLPGYAAQLRQNDPEAYIAQARAARARGDWKSASENFERALFLSGGRPGILPELAEAQARAGYWEEAAATLRRALEYDQGDAGAFRKLALKCVPDGDLGRAAAELEQAASRSRSLRPVLYEAAAAVRERREEYGQALLDYRATIESLSGDEADAFQDLYSAHLAYLSSLLGSPEDPAGQVRSSGHASLEDETAFPGGPGSCSDVSPDSGIPVPGGLSLLANALGIPSDAIVGAPDAAKQVFSLLTEASGREKKRLEESVVRYLKSYRELLTHMGKKRLLPADFDPVRGAEVAFPLQGEKEDLERTRDLLSFFGVKLRSKRSDSGMTVTLSINQSRKSRERQALLEGLGVRLTEKGIREVRFLLRDGMLPLFQGLDPRAGWISGKRRSDRGMLESVVRSQETMRAYLALGSCSPSARAALLEAVSFGDLEKAAEALIGLGPRIEFRNGRLVLPGRQNAWEELLGVPCSPGSAFLTSLLIRDGGRALGLYAALGTAVEPVRAYFTSSAARLKDVLAMMPSFSPDPAGALGEVEGWRHLFSLLGADAGGLFLSLDRRFRGILAAVEGSGKERRPTADPQLLRVGPSDLPQLAGGPMPAGPLRSGADLLELLLRLQTERPDMLSDESIAAVLSNPAGAPVFLDLVWDIDPGPQLFARYLRYCIGLARERNDGWNANRTRTSQSILFLIGALIREGVFDRERANVLLERALEAFETDDEGAFALRSARFLSEELMPSLPETCRSEPDPLASALAGCRASYMFIHNGRRLKFDAAVSRLQRLLGVMQLQSGNPLAKILEIYDLLSRFRAGPEAAGELARRIGELRRPEFEKDAPAALQKSVARADIEPLLHTLSLLAEKGDGDFRLHVRPSAALHPELGAVLLTYCYAYSGGPEIDALAFDPFFVRKHDFYGGAADLMPRWQPAMLARDETRGSFLSGSVSGLGYQLGRLEKSVSGAAWNEDENASPAGMLADLRAVPQPLWTGRAQEYVALSVRLAREIVAAAAANEKDFRWLDRILAFLLSPRRREAIAVCLSRGDASSAAASLAPAELFLIGQAYLEAGGGRSILSSPLQSGSMEGPGGGSDVEKAHELSPAAGQEGAPRIHSPALEGLRSLLGDFEPEAADFRREVEKYGIFLGFRLGLDQHAFSVYRRFRISGRQALYGRMCDLKIRIAEIAYSLGLPAHLEPLLGEAALGRLYPGEPSRGVAPDDPLERIRRLGRRDASEWIDELVNLGRLAPDTSEEEVR